MTRAKGSVMTDPVAVTVREVETVSTPSQPIENKRTNTGNMALEPGNKDNRRTMKCAAVIIVVPGTPVAKARPRLTRRGVAYTPNMTKKYENRVRAAAQTAMAGRPPMDGAVHLVLAADLPVPESWSKTRRAAAITGDTKPTSRPDIDNIIKTALDGLNGIVVVDDAQVVAVEATKKYAPTPKLVVTASPIAARRSRGRASA